MPRTDRLVDRKEILMGLRGPAPKPKSIRVMEGNRSRRPLPTNEPRPLAGEPDMPAHLDREARKEWKRLVPILLAMRVLTVADGVALGNLCQAYSMLDPGPSGPCNRR